jgi:hypothetical protein
MNNAIRSVAGLKAFGACISCPAEVYASNNRSSNCVFNEILNSQNKKVLDSLAKVNELEIKKLNNQCKNCCSMKIIGSSNKN